MEGEVPRLDHLRVQHPLTPRIYMQLTGRFDLTIYVEFK